MLNEYQTMLNFEKTIFLVICLTALISNQTLWSQATDTTKVLFVGNSYTYFWNLPQTVALMAESKNIPLITRQSTIGGSNLGQHWRGDRNLKSKQLVSSGEFDQIILQDFSMQAIQKPDSLFYYGEKFGALIQENDATPFLYMTWSRAWDPYMIEVIQEQYSKLARKINATVVPVGLAWHKAKFLRPELVLYDPDGSHPSPTGTYLTACLFFGALTGENPIGLPARLKTVDKDGEVLYINIQTPNDALFCQKVAADLLGMEFK